MKTPTTTTAARSRRRLVRPKPGVARPVESLPDAPPPTGLQRVRFGYFRPEAREVFLVGSFNDWSPRATPLTRDALGDWSVELDLAPGQYHYRLIVDGEWRDDPGAAQTALNPFGGFDAVVTV
jgi:1,4-alpha-glucan branching enzyme